MLSGRELDDLSEEHIVPKAPERPICPGCGKPMPGIGTKHGTGITIYNCTAPYGTCVDKHWYYADGTRVFD